MPYKNLKDKRDQWRRWEKAHPEKHKENRRIQAKAVYHNPNRQECSKEECGVIGERHHSDYAKPEEIIWLCKMHHEEAHKKEQRLCSTFGCKLPHAARGYCNKHHHQKKRQGVI